MQFRRLPPQGSDPRNVAEIVNKIMDGKTNNTGLITLSTGWATTTTINDERISYDSVILLVPSSDSAELDTAPYGCFTNSTSQTAPSVGSTAVVIYDSTEVANGVYLSNSSRLNVRNDGIYNVQFSIQLINNANDAQYADVWFRVNGTDVPRSASRFDIPARKSEGNPSHLIGTVNTFLELSIDDYVEIAGTTSSTDIGLVSYSADLVIPRPAIPSVIATVQYIAPNSSGNVYVSAQTKGSATLSHFANNTSGKTYKYIVVG